MKFGLENSMKLHASLGFPTRQYQTVHVAGTNGKGSVCMKIAKAYEAEGFRVGLYSSPHIDTFRERICINNAMISEESVFQLLQRIFSILDNQNISATFFEITTALAFKYFADANVDVAVIEVGLGGRLDATNIVSPLLSVITNISYDHMDILGDTLEQITREKAGIIKTGIPLVVGPRVPYSIVKDIADDKQSTCFQAQGSYKTFDEENALVAAKALEVLQLSPEAISLGLQHRPPCRIQTLDLHDLPLYQGQRPKAVVLDVAHNSDGFEQLFHALSQKFPHEKFRVVCGFSKNKEICSCFPLLQSHASFVHLTQADHPRAASAKEIAESFVKSGADLSRYAIHPNVTESVVAGFQKAAEENQILLVFGSFFILSEAKKALGIRASVDPTLLG
jgi:dihydrofolate synthase / folylpolyglutamate synthase